MVGVPELRQAVARHSEKHAGVPCDWATETLVTVGATEGIAACMLGLINEGDEVRLEAEPTNTGSDHAGLGLRCLAQIHPH